MAEKDTRFGGMMEVASSPTAKKEFQKEFKSYQDTKKDDNDKGGGDTGGGLVSPIPVIEIKEPVIEGINTQEVEVEKELFNWKPSLSAEEYEALPLMDKERANWEKFKEIELKNQKEEVV